MAKVWVITGSGNGLGRDIAEAAPAAGDNVVAGARRTEDLAPLLAQYGERVKPITLEVRDEAAAKAARIHSCRIDGLEPDSAELVRGRPATNSNGRTTNREERDRGRFLPEAHDLSGVNRPVGWELAGPAEFSQYPPGLNVIIYCDFG
jgi:NAD(P)-dependent dehydrogenase (short-subunit alcohol dehydrogenase family)